MFTVAGSGFGLYGYLPALIQTFAEPVVLPRVYEGVIRARPELEQYRASIRWVEDPESAMLAATGVVVAKPPQLQPAVVSRCLHLEAIDKLVLEKPLARTPDLAMEVVQGLRSSRKQFRVGYTLLHTSWYSGLTWPIGADGESRVEITWTFMAHHFSNALLNWKREHSEGGGVLRFFGVHLLAMLAQQGYRDVESSRLTGETPGAPDRWRAVFSGPSLPDCRVLVDSRCSTSRFAVTAVSCGEGQPLVDQQDPFQAQGGEAPTLDDRRVVVLRRLLESFHDDDAALYAHYESVNRLWQATERTSIFEAS